MTEEQHIQNLLKPRVKVTSNYPNSPYKIGEIKQCADKDFGDINFYKKFPNIFKEIPWYENRTIDELMSVNYVRITIYTGYWIVGDVVNVTDYKVNTKNKKLEFYILDGTQQSLPERCEPATIEEYNVDKAKRSGRKV